MNKWFFRWHSRLAMFAFLPLLVICVTGSALVFKHELDTLVMAEKVRVPASGQHRLSLDTLADGVNERLPAHEIVGWALFRDQGRADLLYVIPHNSDQWHYILLNQYTGELLSAPVSLTDHFTDWLLSLHYTFLLGEAGIAVTTLYAFLLCFLGISGLYLHRRFWKNFFTLRRNARTVVYYSDLHKMAGVVASPVLLILGITGGYWNIQHLWSEYQEHADGKAHHQMVDRLYNDRLSLQAMRERSSEHLSPFVATYISFPYEPGKQFRFFGDVGDPNPLMSQYASGVTFDAHNGEFISAFDIREAGLGMRVLDSFRRLHFGDFAGTTSRIVWTVIGLLPLVLAFTGVSLWWLRHRKKRTVAKRRGTLTDRSGQAG
ncbi:MAG: PepSY-associated TM helix domain-containing protein [Ketobacteraceae bacterium]|nr:PepSY-associated TM helix domain-containing protein [Ketobacteraceae bacterium]